MTRLDELLSANQLYLVSHRTVDDPKPSRHLAVVTCMDVRIDPLAAFGLEIGEAHVIRNAGGRVTVDVLRSLALSKGVLGVDTVALVQHTGCGLEGATDEALREATGAELDFLPIADHEQSLRKDIECIRDTPYLDGVTVGGFVFDVGTGRLHGIGR